MRPLLSLSSLLLDTSSDSDEPLYPSFIQTRQFYGSIDINDTLDQVRQLIRHVECDSFLSPKIRNFFTEQWNTEPTLRFLKHFTKLLVLDSLKYLKQYQYGQLPQQTQVIKQLTAKANRLRFLLCSIKQRDKINCNCIGGIAKYTNSRLTYYKTVASHNLEHPIYYRIIELNNQQLVLKPVRNISEISRKKRPIVAGFAGIDHQHSQFVERNVASRLMAELLQLDHLIPNYNVVLYDGSYYLSSELIIGEQLHSISNETKTKLLQDPKIWQMLLDKQLLDAIVGNIDANLTNIIVSTRGDAAPLRPPATFSQKGDAPPPSRPPAFSEKGGALPPLRPPFSIRGIDYDLSWGRCIANIASKTSVIENIPNYYRNKTIHHFKGFPQYISCSSYQQLMKVNDWDVWLISTIFDDADISETQMVRWSQSKRLINNCQQVNEMSDIINDDGARKIMSELLTGGM